MWIGDGDGGGFQFLQNPNILDIRHKATSKILYFRLILGEKGSNLQNLPDSLQRIHFIPWQETHTCNSCLTRPDPEQESHRLSGW